MVLATMTDFEYGISFSLISFIVLFTYSGMVGIPYIIIMKRQTRTVFFAPVGDINIVAKRPMKDIISVDNIHILL